MRIHLVMTTLGLMACSQTLTLDGEPGQPGPETADTLMVSDAYRRASEQTVVPGELLVALAWAQTGGQMVEGTDELEAEIRYGVMGLGESQIPRAVELTGLPADSIRHEPEANVLAAAAILEDIAMERGIDPVDLGAWAPAIAELVAIEDADALATFLHDDVYGLLRTGLVAEGTEVKPVDVEVAWPLPAGVERSTVTWDPSPNHSSRSGYAVKYLILHTCEGSTQGCRSTLKNPNNPNGRVSAHYLVDADRAYQHVAEDRKAWHIGADYACSRNDGHACSDDGKPMNNISIGIEHAGYASQSWWSPALIQRSAEIACGAANRHGIPIDRYHVLGHGEMQPWNRTDPGANWPWASYMDAMRTACGETPTGGGTPTEDAIVIDSNEAANGPDAQFTVSSSWWGSTSVSTFYNSGYFVAPAAAVSDPAHFAFSLPASGCARVDAWWPAAGDRPTSAAFIAVDPTGGEIGRTSVDMTVGGGRWNALGSWWFPAGWNEIQLSRWTTPGTYVVADAVRVTPVACQ